MFTLHRAQRIIDPLMRTACVVALALLFCTLIAPIAGAQSPPDAASTAMPSLQPDGAPLAWYEALFIVFLTFWVMFSPLRSIGVYAAMTANLSESHARAFARRAVITAAIAGLVVGILGQFILDEWGISIPALLMAISVVLFLVSIRNLLFASRTTIAPVSLDESDAKAIQLVFPHILSPYGIASLILMMALSHTLLGDVFVFVVFLAVMALTYNTYHTARMILARGGAVLAILGAVMGVLLVALSIQLFINAVYLLLSGA